MSELDKILDKIPGSGSFEAARLSNEALKLGDRILQLCSHPDSEAIIHAAESHDKDKS
jgi:hypothetical protein